MLGEKRNASLFQEEPAISVEPFQNEADKQGEPFRNEPSAPGEYHNMEPVAEDKFQNLQFGPGVDVISGKGNPKPAVLGIPAGRFPKQEDVPGEPEPCASAAGTESPRKMGTLRTHT